MRGEGHGGDNPNGRGSGSWTGSTGYSSGNGVGGTGAGDTVASRARILASVHPPTSGAGSPSPLKYLAAAIVVVALGVVTAAISYRTGSDILIGYWSLMAGVLAACVIAMVSGRKFTHLPISSGEVLAIVPCFNESQDSIERTVRALLDQTVRINEIHVVDDGSATPVVPFDDPRVFWHRKDNGGKRSAHVFVLKLIDQEQFDFVLTVDSDSAPFTNALEHMLRAMSKSSVQATTGMLYIRNFSHNVVTRAADMNIGMSCVMMRASRTMIGALETTSGALALYRSSLVYDYLDEYARDDWGSGDDRWLTIRALLRGDVVAVAAAGVETDMPTTVKGTYRQRTRWARSWWRMVPFVYTNLSIRKVLSPTFGLIQLLVTPTITAFVVYSYAVQGHKVTLFYAMLFASCYALIYLGVASLYLIKRPGLSTREKLVALLIGTPLAMTLNLLLLTPTRYYALARIKSRRWR